MTEEPPSPSGVHHVSPIAGTLEILHDGRNTTLAAPGEITFGRASTVVVAVDDIRVSREHGVIGLDNGSWYVRSTTVTSVGFIVYDCETPSRLHIPPRAGPVTIPFSWAIVSIELLGDRHCFEVRGPGASTWTTNWGDYTTKTERTEKAAKAGRVDTGQTKHVFSDLQFEARNGKMLQWFRVLVAMCEPRLANPPIERIPTDAELARRLGIKPRTLEHHRDRLREELGFAKYDDQTRLASVILALGQGLVTSKDLLLLDRPNPELPN
jgi:hypothetical protein